MAMSADQAMQMLTDHDKAVKDLTEKIEWMYREQCKDKEKIRLLELSGTSAGAARRSMADLKNMNPDKFTGPRGTTSFRQCGQDLKDLASRYSEALHSAMVEVEYSQEPVTQGNVLEFGVQPDEDRQLRSTIRAFTQGEPRNFVSTEVERGTPGLEVWRVLVGLYDPNNDNTRMDESTFIRSPGKAKSMNKVLAIMSKWEDVLNHRSRTLGKAPLDEDLKKSVLLSMLPDTENKELRNQRVLYKPSKHCVSGCSKWCTKALQEEHR